MEQDIPEADHCSSVHSDINQHKNGTDNKNGSKLAVLYS